MIKRVILLLIIALISLAFGGAIMYPFCAFVELNWNLSQWSTWTRMLMVIGSVIAGRKTVSAIISVLAEDLWDE